MVVAVLVVSGVAVGVEVGVKVLNGVAVDVPVVVAVIYPSMHLYTRPGRENESGRPRTELGHCCNAAGSSYCRQMLAKRRPKMSLWGTYLQGHATQMSSVVGVVIAVEVTVDTAVDVPVVDPVTVADVL